jgi:hypothetical protein
VWHKQSGQHRRGSATRELGAGRVHHNKRRCGQVRPAASQAARHKAHRSRDKTAAQCDRHGDVQWHATRRLPPRRDALRTLDAISCVVFFIYTVKTSVNMCMCVKYPQVLREA